MTLKDTFTRLTTDNGFLMPILRPTTCVQPTQKTAFQQSIASAPMAMSMMIDSMVNMMQSSRQPLDDHSIKKNDD